MKGSFKKVITLFVTGVFLTGIITVNVVADVAEDAKAAYWNMVKEQEQAEQLLEQAKAGEDPTEIDLAGKKVEAATMAASILKAIAGGVAQADVIYIVAV